MRDGEFSWHDQKAAINPRKHKGVTFEQAKAVFRDVLADEVVDDREDYGEIRFNLTGRDVNNNLLVVTYTMRGAVKHIISARKATLNERHAFYARLGR
jgi:uncharacterized DUF497 family protein